MRMIVVAIGIVVIAMFTLALFLAYDEERSKIVEVEEKATQHENFRLREDIEVTSNNGTISIDNKWTEETRITGVVVKCTDTDNSTKTAACDPYDSVLSTCNGTAISAIITDLKAEC